MELLQKLEILADAAKYDASCASSGTRSRHSLGGKGVGSSEGSGICHAYAPDGRCISLLKILLTNFCVYECSYCINRNSSNVQRARFTVDEVVRLTLDFYKRNYIEGLFLSSGVIQSPDYTMGQLVEVARRLRVDHDFRGYIHLKTIPDADGQLLADAGRYADRLSINVELPTRIALADLAPEKDHRTIKLSMARIRARQDEYAEQKREARQNSSLSPRRIKPTRFAPAGQSTQMIVGAEPSTDAQILSTTASLYSAYKLKRVYFSAFSPINDASAKLPARRTPLMREHRLYQFDWLIRFYGYGHDEITAGSDDAASAGMLDLDVDPKLAWALRNRGYFPVDLNRAARARARGEIGEQASAYPALAEDPARRPGRAQGRREEGHAVRRLCEPSSRALRAAQCRAAGTLCAGACSPAGVRFLGRGRRYEPAIAVRAARDRGRPGGRAFHAGLCRLAVRGPALSETADRARSYLVAAAGRFGRATSGSERGAGESGEDRYRRAAGVESVHRAGPHGELSSKPRSLGAAIQDPVAADPRRTTSAAAQRRCRCRAAHPLCESGTPRRAQDESVRAVS
jgi:putative DNA modification/repair radical SAM protein